MLSGPSKYASEIEFDDEVAAEFRKCAAPSSDPKMVENPRSEVKEKKDVVEVALPHMQAALRAGIVMPMDAAQADRRRAITSHNRIRIQQSRTHAGEASKLDDSSVSDLKKNVYLSDF